MAETYLLSAGRCANFAGCAAVRTVPKLCSPAASVFSSHLKRFQILDHAANRFSYVPSPSRSSSRQQRCSTELNASLEESFAVVEPRSTTGGARELLTWISELPWPRVAIWLTVALTASQFHDFFGVSTFLAAYQLSPEQWCQVCHHPVATPL